MCGAELDAGWHADHVVPHSKGGATTIENGQALCPSCNQSKSDTMIVDLPENESPRDWQSSFWEDYISSDKKNYLLGACPGSGKSWAAAGIAQYLKEINVIQRVIVFSPGVDKKIDWADDLTRFGVKTTPNWDGRVQKLKGYEGFSMTYNALTHAGQNLGKLASVPTLVIFDEVHHLADEQSWGDTAEFHLERPSVRTLSLTGTPFRSDDSRICFVNYSNGVAQLDFKYDYADALGDEEVVRDCHFKLYEGQMRWESPTTGEKHEATFDKELTDDLKGQRLRCAIDPSNSYLRRPMHEAHNRLMAIRSTGHSDAGGLIVANSETQIEGPAGEPGLIDLVEEVTGVTPVKITSNTENAHDRLDDFRESSEPWVVAIQMISEGVDIKRLRVGLYASAVTTPLYIHQVVGRVIRWQSEIPAPQPSWFWFPRDPRIEPEVEKIREMTQHEIEKSGDGPPVTDSGPEDTLPFISLNAEATEAKLTSTKLDRFDELDPEEIAEQDPQLVAEYIQKLRSDGSESAQPETSGDGIAWREEENLRSEIKDYVGKIVRNKYADVFSLSDRERGKKFGYIHAELNKRVGVGSQEDMTVSQLKEKKRQAKKMLKAAKR